VADRVEAQETAAAHGRIQQAMGLQLANMQKRYRMEIDAAERLTAKRLCHLRTERSAVVVPLQRQLTKAEKREEMEPDVISALSGRGRQNRAPRYEGDDVDLASPRTYGKVLRMKMSTGARGLRVDAPDADARRSASRRSQSAQRNGV
jgi:hypothetical protein